MLPVAPQATRSPAIGAPRVPGGVAGRRTGIILGVTGVRAELSSISSSLGDLTRRVSTLAEEVRGPSGRQGAGGADDGADASGSELASELFTVERSLKGALRRLERVAAAGRRG